MGEQGLSMVVVMKRKMTRVMMTACFPSLLQPDGSLLTAMEWQRENQGVGEINLVPPPAIYISPVETL